jgi:hypothetical protein
VKNTGGFETVLKLVISTLQPADCLKEEEWCLIQSSFYI